jgi:hypothetical protein
VHYDEKAQLSTQSEQNETILFDGMVRIVEKQTLLVRERRRTVVKS